MTCNICENNYGFTFGCGCSFLMCEECADKHLNSKKKDECPQCKQSIKMNIFFSGKIIEEDEYEMCCPPQDYRLLVYDKEKDTLNDFHQKMTHEKMGRLDIDKNQIIKLSDFLNLKKKLPIVKLGPFSNTTGPCILIDAQGGISHGQFYDSCFMDISKYKSVINERNSEMIQKCNVFTLTVNDDNDCFCSYSEWGQALYQNKTLVLNIDKNNEKLKEYHMFALQSLKSFESIPFTKREFIIRYNPAIYFNDFKTYKDYMNRIINLK